MNKTQLAKLLATEDITVRHSREAKTASFDVKNRVLTLPDWAVNNTAVLELLTGHEVAHALWTLLEDWEGAQKKDLHKGILNVVEDARIEKKLKRKYPGIVKSMVTGYRLLEDRGFFYKSQEQLDEFNLMDRINLACKLGPLRGIPFYSETENTLLKAVLDCESWADVEEVTGLLMEHMQSELEEEKAPWQSMQGFGDPSGVDGGSDDSLDGPESDGDFGGSESGDQEDFGGPNEVDLDYDLTIESQDNFDTACEERLTDNDKKYKRDIQYFTLPDPVLKTITVSYKDVLVELGGIIKKLDDTYIDLDEQNRTRRFIDKQLAYNEGCIGQSACMIDYTVFRRNAVKIVGYMAKEFERKKSAQEYRKETVSKTGVLDMSKVFSYKYNDDLFLRQTLRPDGKNHGVIILLDWSASMNRHMYDTLKQVMSLVWFCQKVNIPYEVYAFTTAYKRPTEKFSEAVKRSKDWKGWLQYKLDSGIIHWKLKYGDAHFGCEHGTDSFNLLQLFSNRMNARETTKMMKLVFRLGWGHNYRNEKYETYDLGSTPTLPALVTLNKIIPAFQKHYKLDKTNLIILTDGEGNNSFSKIHNGDKRHGYFSYHTDMRLEDPVSRKEYRVDDYHLKGGRFRDDVSNQEKAVLNLLKDRYGINIIGMFLDGDSTNSIRKYTLEKFLGYAYFQKEKFAKVRADVRKDGMATVKVKAHDEFYIVPVGKLKDNSGELEVDGTMTVGKIKNLFKKNQTAKFGNKVLVNRMMDIIA